MRRYQRFDGSEWRMFSEPLPALSRVEMLQRASATPETEIDREESRFELRDDLHPNGQSVGVHVPECYEPNYAYPLILWFHDTAGSERQLADILPAMSSRNLLGLSLRGNFQRSAGWPQADADVTRFEHEIFETVRQLRKQYHVHSERVIPAGIGSGGTFALRLLMRRPEWFGGAVSINGRVPRDERLHSCYHDGRGTRVFMAGMSSEDALLLSSAGLEVTEAPASSQFAIQGTLSRINAWVVEQICAPVTI